MAAGTWNFTIEQGATFTRTLTWRDSLGVPVPLAGLAARMQLRLKLTDATVILELTTGNGRIVLTDPGLITLHLSAAETAALSFKTASYDLEIVDPTATPELVTRLVQGLVTLAPEVTR
jgi:hypothetical protein